MVCHTFALLLASIDARGLGAQYPTKIECRQGNYAAPPELRRGGDWGPYLVSGRAGAMLGLLWNPVEINGYDLTVFDGSGARLDGCKRYVLRLDPPPNWLPAPAGPFYLVLRHYSPLPAIVTGDWTPPPVTKR